MLYRISVAERGLTGIANIFRSRLSRLDDLLGAGTVPLMIFTIQFFILFSETLIISETKSWVSQNNLKYKSKFEVNRTQRYGASQLHLSCCELIGHRRATDEVVPAVGLRIV